MTKKRYRPTLLVDFDGVIHLYVSPWQGPGVVADGPVVGAIPWLLEMMQHFDVCIFSSRNKSLRGRWAMKRFLLQHLARHYLRPSMEDIRTEFEAAHGYCTPFTTEDEDDNAEMWACETLRKIRFPWFKPAAHLSIDDRCLTFNGDFGELGLRELKLFRPWNKRGMHVIGEGSSLSGGT